MCGLHSSGDREGGEPNGQIVSVKRAADRKKKRSRKIIDEEREKYRVKNGSLRNVSTDSKIMNVVVLINHASAPVRNERLSPMSKARTEASQNNFMEKGGMSDRAKALEKSIVTRIALEQKDNRLRLNRDRGSAELRKVGTDFNTEAFG